MSNVKMRALCIVTIDWEGLGSSYSREVTPRISFNVLQNLDNFSLEELPQHFSQEQLRKFIDSAKVTLSLK